MRVKLEGWLSSELLLALLEGIVEQMGASYGVESFSGVNLYLTPRDQAGELLELLDTTGQPLAEITVPEPKTQRRPRRAKRRPRLKVLDGGRAGLDLEPDQPPRDTRA